VAEKLSNQLKALVAPDVPTWLKATIDRHLEGDRTQDASHIDAGWWHPSALSATCEASLAFQFLGIPSDEKMEPRTRRIFDVGNDGDRRWKRYYQEAGITTLKDDWLPGACHGCGTFDKHSGGNVCHASRHICIPEVCIRGEFDDEIETPEGIFIAETKTKNDALWKAMQAPDPEHIIQVQPYMVARARPKTILVYENKNNQEVKMFEVAYDPELWEQILGRLRSVLMKLRAEEMLLRSCRRCKHSFCPVFDFIKATRDADNLFSEVMGDAS
jgi:hypothetical protein